MGNPAPREGPAEGGKCSRRVLIVDDNVDAASTLAEVMEFSGFEARVVHDGPSALEAAEAWGPDVVVLDIRLPGMDGYEVAQRMRERLSAAPRVIALTGDSSNLARARESGIEQQLTKPVDLDRLVALIGL
ncbi:MAG: response regulator [Myxococcales bacterium]|nr:response regulator [Myxococcales bacterium]